MEQNQQYQLGSWVICPRSNTISNPVDSHSIDNKTMQVLLFLMQHAGEEVSKNQIIEHVWKGTVVAEDILSVAVSKIRKVLGDNARNPTFIKTLPGVGYRLIAQVDLIDGQTQQQSKQASFPYLYLLITLFFILAVVGYFIAGDKKIVNEQINTRSIAVLPFDDLSSAQDKQYFSEGLSEAIINQLSALKPLKVISQFSSFTYQGNYNAIDVGKALQVDTLLDGSVQAMGEHVRINVRIVSTQNGQQLWSKTFDSDNADIFKLQDDISAAVQAVIQPGFIASTQKIKETTAVSAQAYEWYLMGQYHWRQRNPESLLKAVTYFKHCMELAPDYADAHVGLAISYANLHHFANWSERKSVEHALPHINKALALEPNSPTALAAKGMILTLQAGYQTGFVMTEGSLAQQAQSAFLQSLALDDNATTHHWYSALLKKLRDEAQVIVHMNKALELNPLSAPLKRSFSTYLRAIGKLDSAQKMYQRALILEPNHFSQLLDVTHIFRHTQASITAIAKWQAENSELFTHCSSDEYCEQLVLVYLSIGAQRAANSILENMQGKHGHFLNSLGLINYGLAGEEEKVLAIMERLALARPNNARVLFNLATSQYRLGKFQQAKASLLRAYPKWQNAAEIALTDITADNYLAMVLYGATLSHLQEKDSAQALLSQLVLFVEQADITDKVQAKFTLAEINAQLNQPKAALKHLSAALAMGWVTSFDRFDREWWSLASNHLLQPLQQEQEFSALLKQHQQELSELRKQLSDSLNL
ncbi:winged helix-turn-helix domain-containing protein [Litorilituus sediminis]|uniref:OmpR/PhoB-type domain-containing protein n=1 Tax=Litorilituus sediminis TaxID=718192 RepID=A0A4P6P9C7_9GAMM|nr:winged helix-turn-helix domain-containing protein [Litorilituus sediminis]QBG36127.1 hypothetical protein EMK97_10590 [Litorilituus sediminis]